MSFEWPVALLFLLLLPLLVVAYVAHQRSQARYAARWGAPALLPNLVDRAPRRLRHIPLIVLFVALAAMIVGVARPHATVRVNREEATVLLAIDTSRSMGAKDVPPTRLAAAKKTASEFVDRLPEKYRVGLVAFASRAVVALPPSPTTLQQLSQSTGGKFYAAPSNDKLKDVYEELGSRLGKKKEERELTDLFAGGSAVLLLIGGGLSALWFRRLV
jgi:hypothetical protein